MQHADQQRAVCRQHSCAVPSCQLVSPSANSGFAVTSCCLCAVHRSVEEAITSKVKSKKARMRLLNLYAGYQRQSAVNEEEFVSTVGEVMIYGNVAQLRHMATGKFVTIRRTAAEVERGALQVVLEEGGMEGSWFQVFSGYRCV